MKTTRAKSTQITPTLELVAHSPPCSSWRSTPAGKVIACGSGASVCAALDSGNVVAAIHLQAVSGATYSGLRKHEKLRRMRLTKHDRRCFSAKTFWVWVWRALREAKYITNKDCSYCS